MCDCEFPDSYEKTRQPCSLDLPSYSRWSNMVQRCFNKKNKDYKNYGGRGIRICREWLESFETYLDFVGPKQEGKTLDREDNDLNYCPHNIKWSTSVEQNRNRRPLSKKSDLPIGVYWHAQNNNYISQIRVKGKCIHLGSRKTAEECMELFREASLKHFGTSPY